MGIQIGSQLHAPAGFKELQQGVKYYFLSSDGAHERVHLISLVSRPPKKRARSGEKGGVRMETPVHLAVLVAMRKSAFELGLESGAIIPHPHQANLPPWLESLDGRNLGSLDQARVKPKKLHESRIDEILEAIHPLVERYKEILASDNPDKVINKHARECKPIKNETRIRLAFYCYLLFGRSRYALHYATGSLGKWDRNARAIGSKRGRPSKSKGKQTGHNIDSAAKEKILQGYKKYAKLGKCMTSIYQESMTKVFGCLVRADEKEFKSYYHPKGEPFPTYGQFDAHVAKAIGRSAIQDMKLGPNRVRTKLAPSLGMFTQCVANLMERVESDGYVVQEKPMGLVDGSTLKSLVVVRKRDYASGLITGVGFCLGSERASGYRMASFCEAIDKVKFFALFGITISSNDWPSIGASPHAIADRGPGSTDEGYSSDIQYKPVIRGMPPSQAGQSKAVMESSNPKKLKNEEAPSHLRSEKNVFELVRRELRQVLKDNDSRDITDRITPDLWEKVRKPSPNSLWSVLDSLGRNDGVRVSFENAVRKFLPCYEVTVKANGIFLHGQRYDSPALRKTPLLDRVAVSQSLRMDAYVLEACVRHIWIEVDHQLIELDLQVGLRVGDDMLYMSLNEIKLREEEMLLTAAKYKEHRHATASMAHRQYEDETGLKWDGSTRKAGRPKSGTKLALLENAESRLVTHGKRRA